MALKDVQNGSLESEVGLHKGGNVRRISMARRPRRILFLLIRHGSSPDPLCEDAPPAGTPFSWGDRVARWRYMCRYADWVLRFWAKIVGACGDWLCFRFAMIVRGAIIFPFLVGAIVGGAARSTSPLESPLPNVRSTPMDLHGGTQNAMQTSGMRRMPFQLLLWRYIL